VKSVAVDVQAIVTDGQTDTVQAYCDVPNWHNTGNYEMGHFGKLFP
jgi:hypothetical protein